MSDTTDVDPGVVDDLLSDGADLLFAGTCTFDAVQAAEADGWSAAIWDAVAEAGFSLVGVPEDRGGSGGHLADACEVLRVAGAHAAPIPLAETSILGGWLLAEAGLAVPAGPVTVVPDPVGSPTVAAPDGSAPGLSVSGNDDGSVTLDGSASRVPWAAHAETIVTLADIEGEAVVLALAPTDATITPATNVAGEPRPTVTLDTVVVPAERVGRPSAAVTPETFRLRGALGRAMLMSGALEAMSRLTVDYTEQRQQFGRPVARFQAVQQHLVWGAQDAVLAKMAAAVAARQASRAGDDLTAARFEIASAKVVADGCASTATRWAHQAHGAMGMTQEYALHHLSRRLWAWRHEYSRPGEWEAVVGRAAERAGPDGLYPLIAS